MRRVAAAVGSLCVALLLGAAEADSTSAPAGLQPVPPVTASEPSLPQRLDQRRAVRGCAVDEPCGRAAEALRELELERIPRPGSSPWLDERTPPGSQLEAGAPRTVERPSELRPDAPWLDQLALPDLPVRWTQRLVDYLVFYRDDPRGRATIAAWMVAQGRYRDMILTHLRRARLPEDLLYVAMIESSYDPSTQSYAGALGLWQWMPAAAEIYGLRRDRWVDERRDPYRSTLAQLDYFRDLYQRFGSWDIALAAFNAGYGAVLRSIARYNTNDYYQLCEYENGLPWETCWYSPKVLATAIAGRNRAVFGLDQIRPAPAEVWEEVAVPASIAIGVIARAAGATEAEVLRLNPHLRRGRTPPGEPGYVVRVPAGKRVETQRRLAELQSEWDGYDAYVVSHGERFEDVATTFGLTAQALRRLNEVDSEAEISGGTVLVVPRVAEAQRIKNRAKARAALHASGTDQQPGEPLVVPVLDKAAAIAGKQRVFYRVVAGDSLRQVAHALGVSERELVLWNGLEADAKLHPRMVLVAWVPTDFNAEQRRVVLLDPSQLIVVTRGSPEHLDLAEARVGRVRVEYTAQGRERLEDVARKFGMKKYDLARINRISASTTLARGDKVIAYQVVDPTRSERAAEQWSRTPRARRGAPAGERAKRTATAAGSQAPRDATGARGDSAPDADAASDGASREEGPSEDRDRGSEETAGPRADDGAAPRAEDRGAGSAAPRAEDRGAGSAAPRAEDRGAGSAAPRASGGGVEGGSGRAAPAPTGAAGRRAPAGPPRRPARAEPQTGPVTSPAQVR
jgi:membrane-bound lytic murein transglycosylase D